jgi:hypothetical protein
MLVGYMRVSTDTDRQVLDLQRDALVGLLQLGSSSISVQTDGSLWGPSRDLGDDDDRDKISRVGCRLGIHGWNG